MEEESWRGLPPVGTRIRMPYFRVQLEGEVISHVRIWGEPLARIRVPVPVSHEPYETRDVNVSFSAEQIRDQMEIISP